MKHPYRLPQHGVKAVRKRSGCAGGLLPKGLFEILSLSAWVIALAFLGAIPAAAQQGGGQGGPPAGPGRGGRGFGGPGGRGGFGGDPQNQGLNQGPGGPGRRMGPAQVMNLERLLQADIRLQELKQDYARIEQRQAALLDELDKERAHYKPGAIDPVSLLARQAIDKLMGEAHQLTDDSHQNADDAGRLLSGALAMRNLWQPLLNRPSPLPGLDDSQTSATRARWREAVRRFNSSEGIHGFAAGLLGDSFAQVAVAAMPDMDPALLDPGDGTGAGPGPGPGGGRGGLGGGGPRGGGLGFGLGRGRGAQELRALLQDRLARLESRQQVLSTELAEQQREINNLRALLNDPAGFLNNPPPGNGRPGAPPPRPGDDGTPPPDDGRPPRPGGGPGGGGGQDAQGQSSNAGNPGNAANAPSTQR